MCAIPNCDNAEYACVADLALPRNLQRQPAKNHVAIYSECKWVGNYSITVGSQEAPAKIQEVTLMRPFHGNL